MDRTYTATITIYTTRRLSEDQLGDLEDIIGSALDDVLPSSFDVTAVEVKGG